MDTCTLVFATTLAATPCQQVTSCGVTMDQSKKICSSYCLPPPQVYNCERPDGTIYTWTPQIGETTISTDAAR